MMRLKAWVRGIFSNRGRTVPVATPKPSESETSFDSVDYPAPDQPFDVTPMCYWTEGKDNLRPQIEGAGDVILVNIVGAPSVGVRSLVNKVTFLHAALHVTPPPWC